MAVLLFEIVDGFEITVEILALVIPRISRVVYVFVSPIVRQEYFS